MRIFATMLKKIASLLIVCTGALSASAQVNADQVITIGRNVLSMDDYMLAIQYFNLAIKAKPYLSDPYYLRAVAKLSLDDLKGAEEDCSLAIERNKYKADAYKLRGFVRQQTGRDSLAVEDYNIGLRYTPLDKYFLYYKAVALTELKKFEVADSAYSTLLRAYPSFEDGYIARARTNLMRADTLSALADIEKALKITKNSVNAYLMRAEIEANRHEWPAAGEDINEALRLMPKETNLYINRAFIRYNDDDYFGAMSDYNYALELDPMNIAARFNRGLLRYEVKDLVNAAEDFGKVLELEPRNFPALYNRGLVWLELNENKKALSDFETIIRRYPKFYPVYYAIAQACQNLGDMRGAVRSAHYAEELVKDYVENPEKNPLDRPTIAIGRTNRSGSDASSEEDEEEVMNRFNQLVTISATKETEMAYNEKIRGRVQDRDVRVDLQPMYGVGFFDNHSALRSTSNYFRELDDFNKAGYLDATIYLSNSASGSEHADDLFERVESYSRVIETGRGRPADYFARGISYAALRDYEQAIKDLTKAIEMSDGNFAIAYMARGFANAGLATLHDSKTAEDAVESRMNHQLSKGAKSSAIADFDMVLKMNPRQIYAWLNKGNIYYKADDYTSALQCFSEAIKINPDFGEAYFNRALAYLKAGNRQQAFADLSRAGELGILASYNVLKRMK